MKKIIVLAVILSIAGLGTAHAVDLKWTDSNKTVIVDNTVQVTKPSGKWDTQTRAYKDPAPVKWVRHVRDANPQIFLRYSDNVKGQTAHDYATQVVKGELAGRGITVTGLQKKVVNGRHVAVINGTKENTRYMVGVWRHQDKGFQLECIAVNDKFNDFMGEFNEAINSVKIIKEKGL